MESFTQAVLDLYDFAGAGGWKYAAITCPEAIETTL